MKTRRAVVIACGLLVLVGVIAFVWPDVRGTAVKADLAMRPAQHVAIEGSTSPTEPDHPSAKLSADTSSSRRALPPPPAAVSKPYKQQMSTPDFVPAAKAISDWLTSEGDRVMGNPLAAPHQELQSEKPDPRWSPGATQTLTNRLGDDFGGKLEFPSIDCRADMCEIQAATLSANQDDVMMDFQQSVYRLPEEPWWKQASLGAPTFAVKSLPDGRDIIVVFVSRTP